MQANASITFFRMKTLWSSRPNFRELSLIDTNFLSLPSLCVLWSGQHISSLELFYPVTIIALFTHNPSPRPTQGRETGTLINQIAQACCLKERLVLALQVEHSKWYI